MWLLGGLRACQVLVTSTTRSWSPPLSPSRSPAGFGPGCAGGRPVSPALLFGGFLGGHGEGDGCHLVPSELGLEALWHHRVGNQEEGSSMVQADSDGCRQVRCARRHCSWHGTPRCGICAHGAPQRVLGPPSLALPLLALALLQLGAHPHHLRAAECYGAASVTPWDGTNRLPQWW